MANINDISADDSVITSLYVKVNGSHVSTDGISQKNFQTEAEADAFKLGVEFLAERAFTDVVISDVAYGRDGYVVRVVTGINALKTWED